MSSDSDETDDPLILSVITISYNCRDELPETVESVRKQTYDHIEYISIDGASTDGTAEWLENHDDLFDVAISEPDDGRYDAMNKGLREASGDYVMFLNAGDHLRTPSVIDDLFTRPEIRAKGPTIISGRIDLMHEGESLDLRRPWNAGKEGPGLPHPATLVDREVHQAHPFDEQFTYCGDYELWARLRNEDLYDVMYVDDVLTMFDVEGASNSPTAAYERYLERAYVDYMYGEGFGAWDAAKLLFAPLSRQVLRALLGQRGFIKLLRYRRLIKRRLRDHSKP